MNCTKDNNPSIPTDNHPLKESFKADAARTPDGNLNEQELIRRARTGNMPAFGQLVMAYQDRLYNALWRLTGNRDDAAELCQEAFVRALKGLRSFRGKSGFYTWLFRIGMNLGINHVRRKRRVHFINVEADPHDGGETQADRLAQMAESRNSRPDQNAQLEELHAIVVKGLDDLEPPARAIVILRDIEERNYAEISEILEIPQGTVKSRLFRARMMLRDKVKQYIPKTEL